MLSVPQPGAARCCTRIEYSWACSTARLCGLTHLGLSGPSAVQSSEPGPLRLACSFLHTSQEFHQLDVKWYKDGEQEPFLQWIPSLDKRPQLVTDRRHLAGAAVRVAHRATNTSQGRRVDQALVIKRATTQLTGHFRCRVATFYDDLTSVLQITVFGEIELFSFSRC